MAKERIPKYEKRGSSNGMMEIDRKEKCRKRKISKTKISKGINVNDGANVRVKMRVEKIFTSIYSYFHCFWLSIFV
jgi:hypothetical protein